MLRSVSAARKLGHFFAMLFPPLGRAWDAVTQGLARMTGGPRTGALRRQLETAEEGRALLAVVRQFFWDDYRDDRVAWEDYAPEAVAILRPVFLLSLAVTVLAPLILALAARLPAVPQQAIDGANGDVPIPAIALWNVAMAAGWGCVLAGAAFSNRAVSAAAVTFYIYLVAWMPVAWSGTSPSYGNALVPLAALVALGFAERRAHRPGHADCIAGGVHVAIGSFLCGNATVAMTPMVRWLPGHALHFGLALSAVFAILVFVLARRGARPTGAAVPRLAFVLACLTAGAAAWALGRGDAPAMAGGTLASFRLVLGYLWPLWYLVGVGAIFGVLKSTKVVSRAVRVLSPPRLLAPLAAVFFVLGALACWGEALLVPAWPAWLAPVAIAPYRTMRTLLWHVPERAVSAGWLRWVFLADLVAMGWLLVRRRWSRDAAMELVSATLLAMFAVVTYVSQSAGMAHTGPVSPVSPVSPAALFGFMAWLSWLLQKFAVRFGEGNSPSWPDLGRLATAGGFLVLVLAALLARFTAHDPMVKDQLYLYLLRGVVDVGLPYALYVYADRRVAELPLGAGGLFAAFAVGALSSMPLTVFDRWAAAGSWARMQADLSRRAADVIAGALTTSEPALPTATLALRAVFVVGWLLVVAAVVRRLSLEPRHRDAKVLFAVVAAGAGLGSFTRSTLDLPFLTERWQLLLARENGAAQIDYELVATTFAFVLPALVVGLLVTCAAERAGEAVSRPRSPSWWALGALAGYALHLGVTLGWTHREAYLRSSGILPFATAGLFAALAAGVVIARRRIDGEGAPGPVPSIPSVAVPLAAALAAALALSCWLGLRARPTAHPIAGTTATLSLPGSWSPSGPTDGPSLAFRKPSPGLFPPRLFVKRDALGGATPSQYLTRRVRESAASLARFRAFRIESWERHARDAWAVDFAFEQPQKDGSMLPLAGTTAVVPLGGEVLVLTLVASFQDRDALRWDLALAAQRLADEDGGDHRPDR